MNLLLQCSKVIFLALLLSSFWTNAEGQTAQLQEYEKLLTQAIADKDNGKASFYSYEIAKQYGSVGQLDKANQFLNQSLTYGKKANDKSLMYLANQQLALNFASKNDYSKALDNFLKAQKLGEELKRTDFIMESLIQVAVSQAQLNRHKKSIEALDRALSLSLQQGDKLTQQKCYELLSEYHGKLGNTVKAKEYKSLYNTLLQSKQMEEQSAEQKKKLDQQIQQADVEKRTASAQLEQQAKRLRNTEDSLLATKYSLQSTAQSLQEAKEASEKKQLQIDLLAKDKELADLQIKEQHTELKHAALIRNSIIGGLVLAVVLVLVAVTGYRKQIKANRKIDEQHKSIRSSINYAKRIQEAMLPKPDLQKKLLPDSFILLKPRDSVSGDFYWFTEPKSWYNPDVIFTVADCTGHGVPGAFMSLIGINALNGIISKGIAETDQILNALHHEIRTALQQETTGNNDGMDVALCIYRKEKNTIEFSGAKNSLVYIQNNKLFQVKGDVHPIGGSRSKKEFSFKKHLVPIEESTMIYLFSDGYRDQFGGPNNTKFMSKKFNDLLLSIHQRPLEEQKQILDKTIEEWRGSHNQTDDILVMGIRLDAVAI
ncbi:MAG TPA: SpoIIE family protein phosphatase [Ohtaekwangia sp.]